MPFKTRIVYTLKERGRGGLDGEGKQVYDADPIKSPNIKSKVWGAAVASPDNVRSRRISESGRRLEAGRVCPGLPAENRITNVPDGDSPGREGRG